jgi:hypothetical protein
MISMDLNYWAKLDQSLQTAPLSKEETEGWIVYSSYPRPETG